MASVSDTPSGDLFFSVPSLEGIPDIEPQLNVDAKNIDSSFTGDLTSFLDSVFFGEEVTKSEQPLKRRRDENYEWAAEVCDLVDHGVLHHNSDSDETMGSTEYKSEVNSHGTSVKTTGNGQSGSDGSSGYVVIDKHERRKEQNRRAAHNARMKKKSAVNSLQDKISSLTAKCEQLTLKNQMLETENTFLKDQIGFLKGLFSKMPGKGQATEFPMEFYGEAGARAATKKSSPDKANVGLLCIVLVMVPSFLFGDAASSSPQQYPGRVLMSHAGNPMASLYWVVAAFCFTMCLLGASGFLRRARKSKSS